ALGTNLLVGAPGAAESAGKAFLFDGATGQLLATFTSPTAAAGAQFGAAIAAIGSDILVGAPSDSAGATAAGAAYVFHASGARLPRYRSRRWCARRRPGGWRPGVSSRRDHRLRPSDLHPTLSGPRQPFRHGSGGDGERRRRGGTLRRSGRRLLPVRRQHG